MRPPASVEKLYTATTALALIGPDRAASRRPCSASATSRRAASGKATCTCAAAATRRSAARAFIAGHYGGAGRERRRRLAPAARAGSPASTSVTGSIHGDESFFDSLPRRALERLRPRPVPGRHPQRPRLQPRRRADADTARTPPPPTPPAALLGALKADGVSDRAAAAAPPPRPPGAIAARGCAVPAARSAARPDAAAVGQLLRRDARQGPRRPLRRRRHDGRRRRRRRQRRSPRCSASIRASSTARGSPKRTAPRPTRSPTCSPRLAGTPIGPVLREQHGGRGAHRHARAAHAPTPRAAGRCQGKTGTLTGVSNLAGYCPAANGHMLAFAIFTDGICERHAPHMLPGPHARSPTAPPTDRAARAGPPRRAPRTPRRSAFSSFEPGLSPATT